MQGLAFWRGTGTNHGLIASIVAKVCCLGKPWEALAIPVVSDSQRKATAHMGPGEGAKQPRTQALQGKTRIQRAET